MVWYANVVLKSGNNVLIDNLMSINTKSTSDSSIKEIKDFKTFHLTISQRLSFIGENSVVSLMSDEISYVELITKS